MSGRGAFEFDWWLLLFGDDWGVVVVTVVVENAVLAKVAQRLRIGLHGAREALRLPFQCVEQLGSIVAVVRNVLTDEIVGDGGELLFHFMK